MNAINESSLTASDRAYKHIKHAILNMEYGAQARLGAQDLAEQLDISRTPVREALSRLEQERLVVRNGGWGYVVRAVTFKEAKDLYKVREALEAEAAKEAIPNLSKSAIAQLEGLLVESERKLQSGDIKGFRASANAFHRTIASLSDNEYLQGMLLSINDKARLIGGILLQKYKLRARDVVKENRAILRALKTKDSSAVETAVREHVKKSWETVVTHVLRERDSEQFE